MPAKWFQKIRPHSQVIVEKHDRLLGHLGQEPVVRKQEVVPRSADDLYPGKSQIQPYRVIRRTWVVQHHDAGGSIVLADRIEQARQQDFEMFAAVPVKNRNTNRWKLAPQIRFIGRSSSRFSGTFPCARQDARQPLTEDLVGK